MKEEKKIDSEWKLKSEGKIKEGNKKIVLIVADVVRKLKVTWRCWVGKNATDGVSFSSRVTFLRSWYY